MSRKVKIALIHRGGRIAPDSCPPPFMEPGLCPLCGADASIYSSGVRCSVDDCALGSAHVPPLHHCTWHALVAQANGAAEVKAELVSRATMADEMIGRIGLCVRVRAGRIKAVEAFDKWVASWGTK